MLCCSCKKNQATNIHEKTTDGRKQTEYYCADCYRRLFISAPSSAPKNAVCPRCKTTAEEFFRSGLVGCADCYTYLAAAVDPVVFRMQGGDRHVGKHPPESKESRFCKEVEKTLAKGGGR